jgi:hypothetical protein
VPIAIAVTPSLFYAVVPPLFILAPMNALLALYIVAVTLVKTLERGTPPFIPLAFVFLAALLMFPLLSPVDVLLRLFTAVFLAVGVLYAAEKDEVGSRWWPTYSKRSRPVASRLHASPRRQLGLRPHG